MSVADAGSPAQIEPVQIEPAQIARPAPPRVLEQRVIQVGSSDGARVRCGLIDISLSNLPTSVVFFYSSELDYPEMARGLRTALTQLPVFAGRLRTDADGLYLLCDDSGVPFVHAQMPETMAEAVARMTLSESGFVNHVQATAAKTADLPLFTARLSRLSDGGSALGISWHHAVGDLQSALLLMQAWSAAMQNTQPPQPILLQDRDAELLPMLPETDSGRPSFRLPESEAEQALIQQTILSAPRTNRTVQVYFTKAELQRLQIVLSDRADRRLSVNDAVCGHLTSTLWELAEDDQPRRVAVPVNVRRHLRLPAELVGNILGEVLLSLPPRSDSATIAAAIRDGIDHFGTNHLSLRANHDYLDQIGRSELERCVPIGFDPARRTVVLSNWSRFGLYRINFGGHDPVAFSPAATAQIGWVGWLVEGFGGEGLLGTLALPAKLASKLRSAELQAVLHQFRDADEELPALARQLRKLA